MIIIETKHIPEHNLLITTSDCAISNSFLHPSNTWNLIFVFFCLFQMESEYLNMNIHRNGWTADANEPREVCLQHNFLSFFSFIVFECSLWWLLNETKHIPEQSMWIVNVWFIQLPHVSMTLLWMKRTNQISIFVCISGLLPVKQMATIHSTCIERGRWLEKYTISSKWSPRFVGNDSSVRVTKPNPVRTVAQTRVLCLQFFRDDYLIIKQLSLS